MTNGLHMKKKRDPDRTRSTATISITWSTYDKLEGLAGDHSIGTTIDALVAFYRKHAGRGEIKGIDE